MVCSLKYIFNEFSRFKNELQFVISSK